MSEKIKTSLDRLNGAANVLEAALERKAKSFKAVQSSQQDLFGGFVSKAEGANSNKVMSPDVVAARLDNAIHEVEKLLQES